MKRLIASALVVVAACGQSQEQDPAKLKPPASSSAAATQACVDFGPARGYGVFVLGSFNAYYSDVEGSLAAGVDVSVSAYEVGALLPQAGSTAVVTGRDFTLSDGYVAGNVIYGRVASVASDAFVDGTVEQGAPIDFAGAATQLSQRSQSLAGITANGTTTLQWGGVYLSGSDSQLNVFEVPADALSSSWGVVGNVPVGSTALINVRGGPAVQMHWMAVQVDGAAPEDLVMNFPEATTLTLDGVGVPTNLLAPQAAVQFDNGLVTGTIVSASFAGGGQVNTAPFLGCIPISQDLAPPVLTLSSTAPATAIPGETVQAAFTAANTGDVDAASAGATVAFSNGASQVINFGAIAAGQSATLSAPWPIPAGATDGQTLTAVGSLTWTDANGNAYGPVASSLTLTVVAPALTLSAQAPVQARAADAIAYSLTLKNTGHATATAIAVSAQLAGGSTATAAFPLTLDAGASLTVSLPFTVPVTQPAGAMPASFTALWTDADGVAYGPFSASASTNILAAPLMSFSFAGDLCVGPGFKMSYTAAIENVGDAPAAATTTSIVLPDGTSVSQSGGALTVGATFTEPASYLVPALAGLGAHETAADYAQRLAAVDGTMLPASATASWTDGAGVALGPIAKTFASVERVPIVLTTAAAPLPSLPGQPIQVPFSLQNVGGGNAYGVRFTATGPSGASQTLPQFNLQGGQAKASTLSFTAPAVNAKQSGETDAAYLTRLQGQDGQILTFSFSSDWVDGSTDPYGPLAEAVHTYEVLPIIQVSVTSAAQLPNGQPGNFVSTFHNVGSAIAQTPQFSIQLPNGTKVPLDAPAFLAPDASVSYTSEYNVPASPSSGNLTAVATASWTDSAATPYGPMSGTHTVPIAQANTAPVVSAGSDQVVTLPHLAQLNGSVVDDGLPLGQTLSIGWGKQGGPGDVSFTNAFSAVTQASFSEPGQYVLALYASDGALSSEGTVHIAVLPASGLNQPPIVSAGPSQTTSGRLVTLSGTVQDDGLPAGAVVTSSWTQLTGPAAATIVDPTQPITNVDLPSIGTYSFRLRASDSEFTVDSTTTVIRIAASTLVMDAGPAPTVRLGQAAPLTGHAAVDGAPIGSGFTTTWTLVSGPGTVSFADANALATSATFLAVGQYTLQLAVSSGGLSGSVQVIATVLPASSTTHQPPSVSAGASQTVSTAQANLVGSVQTDGLAPAPFTSLWTQLSGPANAVIAAPSSLLTAIAMPAAGTYSFNLTVNDTQYTVSASTNVTLQLTVATNQPPSVDPGPDQLTSPGVATPLAGVVTDDGLPLGTLTSSWSFVSGPGPVTFANAASPSTTATFSFLGTYVLRLSASDSEWVTAADVQVTVAPPPSGPSVTAGPAQTITLPAVAQLAGAVTDNDEPPPVLTDRWTLVSGPGAVSFANASLPQTQASFSLPGSYLLLLSVSDGTRSASAQVAITVLQARLPPTVDAGPDQTLVAGAHSATLTGTVVEGGPPRGLLQSIWTLVSGPAPVHFADPRLPATTVAFDLPGLYTLRLTAVDGELSAFADVHITLPLSNAAVCAPVLSLDQTLDGAHIVSPTKIAGSVSCGDWLVEIALDGDPGDNPAWKTIGSGTGATTGTLATLDPTQLLNGTYIVQLLDATESGSQSTSISVVVDKNQKVGNFAIAFTDLVVGSPGLPIALTRSYDSRDNRVGDFGHSWQLSLGNIRLEKSAILGKFWEQTQEGSFAFPTYCLQPTRPAIVTATFPNGKVYRFQASTSPSCQQFEPIDTPDMVFTPMDGTVGTLSAEQSTVFVSASDLSGPAQLFDTDGLTIYNEDHFGLTVEDGTTYFIQQHGEVEEIVDVYGNAIILTADGIIASSGASVSFTRDSSNRITSITDPSGVPLLYDYDAAGNLAHFTDRTGAVTTFGYDADGRMILLTDPRGVNLIANDWGNDGKLADTKDASGNMIQFNYDAANNREQVTDRLGYTTTYEYDEDGNVIKLTDALGNVTLDAYDQNDNKLTETDALGHKTSWTYDDASNMLSKTDPLGNTTTWTYDNYRQVLTVVDPLGRMTTNDREDIPVCGHAMATGNLLASTDPLGNTTQYSYNCDGTLASQTDARGATTAYTYDATGHMLSMTDALAHLISYNYDANGNQLTESKIRTKADGSTETLTTGYAYDANGRRTQTTYTDGSATRMLYNAAGSMVDSYDVNNRNTHYDYDSQARLTKTTNPDGTTTLITYDANGRDVATTDRGGRSTAFAYDAVGRLIQTTLSDGATRVTAYDAVGEVKSSLDELGNSTNYIYDDAGRRIKISDALNQTTTLEYDADGNQSKTIDPLGHSTSLVYDADGQLISTIYADGTHDDSSYDQQGNRITRTDQAGMVTHFAYDLLGKLISVIDANGQTTGYAYDEVGNRILQTDANGHVTNFEFDSLGRRIAINLPLGQRQTMSYFPDGLLKSSTDFNGRTTTFGYTSIGQLSTRTPDVYFMNQGEQTVAWTYYTSGQRQSMVDTTGTTSYTYDSRDRLLVKTTPHGTLMYEYDAAGNTLSARSDSGQYAVSYGYDALNRLSMVSDNNADALDPTTGLGERTAITYDATGHVKTVAYPNGVTTAQSYDDLGRIASIASTRGTTALSNYSYQVFTNGNRRSVSELGGRTVSWSYDALSRLTSETIAGTLTAGTASYNYDGSGNRLKRTSSISALPTQASSYDANNRVNSQSWDDNGSTLLDGSDRYTYDSERRLISVDANQGRFVYDGLGQLVGKTEGGVTTTYLVDDQTPMQFAQIAEERTTDGVTKSYVYGLQRLSMRAADGVHWYAYDAQSGVRAMLDAAGSVTDTYEYDAFGTVLSHSGTTSNEFTYRGEQVDDLLGLQYLRARWLKLDSGRFISRDSYDGDLGEPLSLNKYLYAQDEPVQHKDGSGFFTSLAEVGEVEAIEEEESIQNVDEGLALEDVAVAQAKTIQTTLVAAAARTAISTGTVLGLAALTVLKSDEKDDQRKTPNRGSIQIQGDDLRQSIKNMGGVRSFVDESQGVQVIINASKDTYSFSWNFPSYQTISKSGGIIALEALWTQLNSQQQRNRVENKQRAQNTISTAPPIGHCAGSFFYRSRADRRTTDPSARIDLKVDSGCAFVDDGAVP